MMTCTSIKRKNLDRCRLVCHCLFVFFFLTFYSVFFRQVCPDTLFASIPLQGDEGEAGSRGILSPRALQACSLLQPCSSQRHDLRKKVTEDAGTNKTINSGSNSYWL